MDAIANVEQNGIVFLDEIDKITARSDRMGADVSREGVQRDLLPLIEGTSGRHQARHCEAPTSSCSSPPAPSISPSPSDLLPELQGRLPIRVELAGARPATTSSRILTEPETQPDQVSTRPCSETEEVTLDFTEDSIEDAGRLWPPRSTPRSRTSAPGACTR